jgi:hypothetical protein
LEKFLNQLPKEKKVIHKKIQKRYVRKQRYIGGYINQPRGCNQKSILLFAMFGNDGKGRAEDDKWIARLPLSNSGIVIYFPNKILNDGAKLKIVPYNKENKIYDYAVLRADDIKNLNDFIKNPADFLDLDKIKTWITGE